MAFEDIFSIQVFFLVFREVLESAIIMSVLLSFLKRAFNQGPETSDPESQKMYYKLRRQVWAGSILGILLCFVIGGLFIAVFYYVGTNLWDRTEKLWEGFFCILASVMITVMGKKMLRMNKMQEKWRLKLARIIVDQRTSDQTNVQGKLSLLSQKYAMALLPFVTTLREGLEAVAFLGGLGASAPASSIPLAVLTAVALGATVGYVMYSWGTFHVSIRYFILFSTCFLYLVAAGLLSRGVWFLEMHRFISKVGQDISENGSGPGSYDISNTVWHVDCCNPETDGPYMIFSALLGWQNSATYGSVISYNLYWLVIILMVIYTMRKERKYAQFGSNDERESLITRATAAIAGQ